MTKAELRKKYFQKRMLLSSKELQILSEAIIKNFILQFKPTENQKIHCFLPIEKFNEINTYPLINYCWDRGIKVFIPKIIGDDLIAVEYNENTVLKKNHWGILEPQTDDDSSEKYFDFIISPLLYCDEKGNRIGYGKGFYDNLFDSINLNCRKIGVSFYPPKEKIDDLRESDIPLDYLVTPISVLSFGIDTLKSIK